jgi:excisionase family DNA binding protein
MTNSADGWTQESLFTDRPRALRQAQPRRPARPPVADPIPHLIDITEVAEHLGVQVRHVRRLVAERRIPYLKWGHHLRFNPVEIREWLDDARVVADGK